MHKFLTLFLTALLAFGLAAGDAEAAKRRLGGGQNLGYQRQNVSPAPPKAPAQQGAAAGSRFGGFGGILAGLAAGGLLAALFAGGAFEGLKLMDVVLIGALAFMLLWAFRALRGARGAPQGAMQRQAVGAGAAGGGFGMPSGGGGDALPDGGEGAYAGRIPPGFQVDAFLRQAKVAFVRLQEANDRGDLADIREFTAPEVFAEVRQIIQERGDVPQHTEVVTLNADLLDVLETPDRAIASVRFTGMIREEGEATAQPFEEIWHVRKDLKDSQATWLVAGIQQVG